MSVPIVQVRCSKSECEVALTGSCVEGHDPLGSCPFFGIEAVAGFDDNGDIDVIDDLPQTGDERIVLPQGEPLNVEEVDQFLRWRGATFITIIGERDSGKTTLICAIYDRFLRGPFAGCLFAGSRTLVGLERRSHYARIDSGRLHPDTPRTSISEGLRFFHFAIRNGGIDASRSDLMLSDRAGEIYSLARSNSSILDDLVEIEKADRLVLLLDGARIAEPVEHAGALQAVRQSLRAFIDAGKIGKASRVQVITTKVDLIKRLAERSAIEESLLSFQHRLVADFAEQLAELSFWEVAARDPSGELCAAHGIDELLADWVTPRSYFIPLAELTPLIKSEFDRLLLRTRMGSFP